MFRLDWRAYIRACALSLSLSWWWVVVSSRFQRRTNINNRQLSVKSRTYECRASSVHVYNHWKSIIYYRSTSERNENECIVEWVVSLACHISKWKRDDRCRSDHQKNPFDTCLVNADICIHLTIRPIFLLFFFFFFTIEFDCPLAHFGQAYYRHHHFFCVHTCMQTHVRESFFSLFKTESCIVCRLASRDLYLK